MGREGLKLRSNIIIHLYIHKIRAVTVCFVKLFYYSVSLFVLILRRRMSRMAGFEPAILAGDRPQTLALNRSATGIGILLNLIIEKYVTRSFRGRYQDYYIKRQPRTQYVNSNIAGKSDQTYCMDGRQIHRLALRERRKDIKIHTNNRKSKIKKKTVLRNYPPE